jgi:hypothetical protein
MTEGRQPETLAEALRSVREAFDALLLEAARLLGVCWLLDRLGRR